MALKTLLFGRFYGSKLLKSRPSTGIYRPYHADHYLQRNRLGNGHEMNLNRRLHGDTNRLTPTFDTPTNLTPLSVTPFSATPTNPRSNPFCESFKKALTQTLEKESQSEAENKCPEIAIVSDTLKIAALPTTQLDGALSMTFAPACPLIQVSTIPSPTEDKSLIAKTSTELLTGKDVADTNSSTSDVSPQRKDSILIDSNSAVVSDVEATEEGYISDGSQSSNASNEGADELTPLSPSHTIPGHTEQFESPKILTDPPYRDDLPPDSATDVQNCNDRKGSI